MSDIIEKLRRAARSERKLGNTEAALAYEKKARELEAREKAARGAAKIKTSFVCSCGFSGDLDIDAGEMGAQLAEMILAPHRKPGHILREFKQQ
jgi:hypothetical protein